MDSDRIRLHTKSGAEYTERLPGMVENFKRLPMRSAIINGELCLVAADGLPRFYWLLHDATRWPDETDRMYLICFTRTASISDTCRSPSGSAISIGCASSRGGCHDARRHISQWRGRARKIRQHLGGGVQRNGSCNH